MTYETKAKDLLIKDLILLGYVEKESKPFCNFCCEFKSPDELILMTNHYNYTEHNGLLYICKTCYEKFKKRGNL